MYIYGLPSLHVLIAPRTHAVAETAGFPGLALLTGPHGSNSLHPVPGREGVWGAQAQLEHGTENPL